MAWGDESAFPHGKSDTTGMLIRDYIAMHLATGLLRWSVSESNQFCDDYQGLQHEYARFAYVLADAIIEERDSQQ